MNERRALCVSVTKGGLCRDNIKVPQEAPTDWGKGKRKGRGRSGTGNREENMIQSVTDSLRDKT